MEQNQQALFDFMSSQKFLVLATVDEEGKPWIANVYFSVNEEFELFFVSPASTKHSKHIGKNPSVAFSTVWHDQDDLGNRKGIQGTGICERITNPLEITRHLDHHYKYFPAWRSSINLKNIIEKVIESRPYKIKADYIKFWNDELYGKEGTKEFSF